VLTNQDYAIKIVPKSTLTHPILHKLMRQELEVLANVNHPNIMRIYELLEDDINYYIVSEIIAGGELFEHICKEGKLNSFDATRIIKQILRALAHMHEQGIIHRDLKPENILMEDYQNVKVADFGFAVPLKGRKQT
jgi:serine/threonine protein kinase